MNVVISQSAKIIGSTKRYDTCQLVNPCAYLLQVNLLKELEWSEISAIVNSGDWLLAWYRCVGSALASEWSDGVKQMYASRSQAALKWDRKSEVVEIVPVSWYLCQECSR